MLLPSELPPLAPRFATAALRKERSFADGSGTRAVAFAALRDRSYERAESARKLSFPYGRGERAKSTLRDYTVGMLDTPPRLSDYQRSFPYGRGERAVRRAYLGY